MSVPHAHHSHSHGLDTRAPRALRTALTITLGVMILEAVGGLVSGSLALLSDAGHMLTDVGALSLALLVSWMSRLPKSRQMSFGYHRAEILGALASALLIWFLAGALVLEALERFAKPEPVQGGIVLGISVIGLLANLLSLRVLHSSKDETLNSRAAYLHVASDALSSIGAAIAGGILMVTDWLWVDPLVSIGCAALMLWGSFGLIRDSVHVLMEAAPDSVDPEAIERRLRALPGVTDVHDLHVWTLASGRTALSVHVVAPGAPQTLLLASKRLLHEEFEIDHTTIQVEDHAGLDEEACQGCTI